MEERCSEILSRR